MGLPRHPRGSASPQRWRRLVGAMNESIVLRAEAMRAYEDAKWRLIELCRELEDARRRESAPEDLAALERRINEQRLEVSRLWLDAQEC